MVARFQCYVLDFLDHSRGIHLAGMNRYREVTLDDRLETLDQAKPRVLVVDDDPLTRSLLSLALQAHAFEVIPAGDAGTALEQVRSEAPEIVILDLRLPGLDGMEALRRFKEIAPELPVVILTGYGDVPSAVEAMRLGAYDFLTKPVEPAKVLVVVRRALKHRALGTELKELRRLGQRDALRWLMGRGQEIQQVIQQIRQVADSNFTILIQGETGTGKELVARSIHQLSARREKPFVALDCGAIPETLIESELFGYERGAFTGADRRREGHFQLAQGGTLFLDEAVQVLLRYHWPGNVRELRNVIRRAVLLSADLVEPAHLLPLPANSPEARPVEVSAFLPPGLPLREMARMAAAEAERLAIRQALRTARGNKSEAARILGTDFKTLHLKMRRYGIRPGELS